MPSLSAWAELPTVAGIYAIRHTASGHLYIGSSNNLRRRCWEHLKMLRAKTHKNAHLRAAFHKYGEEAFDCFVLEEVADLSALLSREQFFLDTLAPHFNLSNKATAGHASPEGRERQRAAGLARMRDPHYRAILDTGRMAMWADPAHRQRMSELSAGRVFSEESRAKMSASHKGKTLPPEQRAKQSATLTGRKQKPEHTAKVAAALRGRSFSEETRRRLSEAQRRRFSDPQERARNAETIKAARLIAKADPEIEEKRKERARAAMQTPEYKQKRRDIQLRRAADPEYRTTLRAAANKRWAAEKGNAA